MTRRGRDLLLDILRSEGVQHVFGNPGTTEMPLIDGLSRQTGIEYVLALQESTAIGMADGYAQITGRPAFVNVHAAGGLGNAMGNITNARANHAPLVITAGQQDQRHLVLEPLLAGDLVSMPKEWVKSSREAHTTRELGLLLRRAFREASVAPRGPTFLSMPMNLLDQDCGEPTPARSSVLAAQPLQGLEALTARLLAARPGGIAFVMGDEARAESCDDLVELATQLGATVFGAPMHGRLLFPTDHALWAGPLPFSAEKIRDTLKRFEQIVFFGDQAFLVYLFSEVSALPEGVEFIHVSADPTQLGRVYPTAMGIAAEPAAVIVRLAASVGQAASQARNAEAARFALDARDAKASRDQEQSRRADQRSGQSPMDPMAALRAVMQALRPDTLVVDEAITASAYVRGFYRGKPSAFLGCRGGGLGWGMPAAVGASLGSGRAPTVCLVGDGSAMYSPQALWTAARMQLPVLFVVINNGEYRILKQYGANAYAAGRVPFVGLDLDDPAIDFLALAASMGVPARRASTEAQAAEAVHAALASGRPALLELAVRP